ncbi:MAG: hypothetical protein ACRDK0_10700, partial [Solirubrobacteraceae bacterium]
DRGLETARGVADRGLDAARGAAEGVLGDLTGALGGKQDPDELYEQVLERLRRDLVAELEQSGHLLRDHP